MAKAKFDVTDGRIPVSRIELGDILITRGLFPWTRREEHVIEIESYTSERCAQITTARKKNNYFFYLKTLMRYIPSEGRFESVNEELFGVNTIGYEKARNGLISIGVRV